MRKRRSHPLQANGDRNQGLRMLLVRMTERLVRCDTFEHAIWIMLDDAIALLGAEYENVQRLIGDQLVISAQRGLLPDFLKAFGALDKMMDRLAAERCGSASQL